MNDLKAQIDHMKQTRETIANSPLMNQFSVQLFDPINLFALPFGGPTLGMPNQQLELELVLLLFKLRSRLVDKFLILLLHQQSR